MPIAAAESHQILRAAMKEIVKSVITIRTNVFVTLATVVVSSLTTLLLAVNLGFIVPDTSSNPTQRPLTPTAAGNLDGAILECEAEVYSPVQNRCVPQDVFDAEMQRLLTALGLDGSLYQQHTSTKQ